MNISKIIIIPLLLLLGFLPLESGAQIYIGAEGGLPFDIIRREGPTDGFYTRPNIINVMWGFNIGMEINNKIALETGIYNRLYGTGYGVFGPFNSFYFNEVALEAWQIPLRTKFGYPFANEKIKLLGILGTSFSINSKKSPVPDFGT
jgi:hypothetical protein